MSRSPLSDFGIDGKNIFVGGQWVPSASNAMVELFNPADETAIMEVCEGSTEDADRALQAARRAQKGWREQSAVERGEVLHSFRRKIMEHIEPLARLLTMEVGKPLGEARGEIMFTDMLLQHAAECARRLEGEILPVESRFEQLWIQRVPYGVVAGMTAWNFPAALFARKLGPALVTGNTIVIKPHELTPLCTLALAELARQAGVPDGVINLVVGGGRSVGARLVESSETDLVSMTGSPRAGQEICALGAARLKVLRLELGGKAPFLVMEDADIDRAVQAALFAKLLCGGQICTGNERMYLHEKIHDEFLEKFVKAMAETSVGDPMTDVQLGPKISAFEVKKLEDMTATAVAEGAEILTGGERPQGETFARGHWYSPTVLSVKSNDLKIMREEIFGPIVPAMKVGSYEEAVALANDTEYGLSSYLWTNDNRRIMSAVNDLEFGEIYVNRSAGESVHGFHTGYNRSGLGGEDGKHGVEGFMRKKSVYNNYS